MIYLILGEGFEEIEAVAVVDILRRGGKSVTTVSLGPSNVVTGGHGIPVTADILISEADPSRLSCLIMPGGLDGVESMEKSGAFMALLDEAYKNDCLLCAICAAPKILGEKGYLKGKKATCYPGFQKHFTGGTYIKSRTCRDGRIITANGPGSSFEFACEILRAFGIDPNQLMEGMQYAKI